VRLTRGGPRRRAVWSTLMLLPDYVVVPNCGPQHTYDATALTPTDLQPRCTTRSRVLRGSRAGPSGSPDDRPARRTDRLPPLRRSAREGVRFGPDRRGAMGDNGIARAAGCCLRRGAYFESGVWGQGHRAADGAGMAVSVCRPAHHATPCRLPPRTNDAPTATRRYRSARQWSARHGSTPLTAESAWLTLGASGRSRQGRWVVRPVFQ